MPNIEEIREKVEAHTYLSLTPDVEYLLDLVEYYRLEVESLRALLSLYTRSNNAQIQ